MNKTLVENWRKLVLESIVIVGSILLAFGIDALWQDYNERQTEVTTISNLEREFRVNQERIEQAVSFSLEQEELILELLTNWDSSSPNLEFENSLIFSLLFQGTLNITNGAFESYISNGGDVIQDQELRNLLHSWPGAVAEYKEDEDADTLYVQEVLRPYLAEMTDYSRLLDVHPIGAFTRLPDSDIDYEGLSRILNDPLARNHLARRYSNKNLIRREAERLLQLNESILSLLSDKLE